MCDPGPLQCAAGSPDAPNPVPIEGLLTGPPPSLRTSKRFVPLSVTSRRTLVKGNAIYKVTFVFRWFSFPVISEETPWGMSAGNKLKYFSCLWAHLLIVCIRCFDI